MTPIVWHNGGPLLVGGTLVGGGDRCCCGQPPECECPDLCKYQIRPSTSDWNLGRGAPDDYCSQPFESGTAAVACDCDGESCQIYWEVRPEWHAGRPTLTAMTRKTITISGGAGEYAKAGLMMFRLRIFCDAISSPPGFRAEATVTVYANDYEDGYYWEWREYQKEFPLPATCYRLGNADCTEPSADETRLYLTMPIEIAMTADDITLNSASVGAPTLVRDESAGTITAFATCVLDALADYTGAFNVTEKDSCASLDFGCCCKADGTIVETVQGEDCDGTITEKPAGACDWDGVELTFTIDGTEGTALVSDWTSGNEPDFVGLGSGNLPNNKSFDTSGSVSCPCNLRVIYLEINYSGACFYTFRINECTNQAVLTRTPVGNPDTCTAEPVIVASVNWAP